ncbi:MAG: CcdB family protein [Proteobacteria bacterium]|nr:CcdB family protein [Pseudomonadota bacterium]
MARFDVFSNPFAPERSHTPFVLDVQNDHLGPLATRVVIPLRTPKGFGQPARGLNPLVEVNGRTLVVDTASIAPVPSSLLKSPVLRAAPWRDDVLDALDTLFGSY